MQTGSAASRLRARPGLQRLTILYGLYGEAFP
jgi:hypothetical protein